MAARRPRGRNTAAVAAATRQRTVMLSAAANGGGMFFAAPVPPTLAAKAPTVSPLGSRGLKPTPQKSNLPKTTNQQFQHVAVDAAEECSATEKLAFDELLRLQRGRAEDVGRLIALLGGALGGASMEEESRRDENENDNDKSRRAAKYREEWRVARENDVFDRVHDAEAREMALPPAEQERKVEALRSHVRRSIHYFLIADRGDASVARTPKAKISNDLFYAQQMDRLLREMDQHHPFTVVRQAIADARVKFEQLLLGCSQTYETSALADVQHTLVTSLREELVAVDTEQPETNLLGLYENVVDARSLAQALPCVRTTKAKSKALKAAPAIAPSEAFMGNLGRQREEAESLAREALAQSHWRTVSANRMRSAYVAYRKRQRHHQRKALLWQRTRDRATTVLQTTLLRAVRAFRVLTDARDAMKRKHQGRRIASCCFWQWMYPARCGFAHFRFRVVVTTDTIVAIVRIQSHWRRRRATRDTIFRRAFQSLRGRRRKQRQWSESRRRAQALASTNQQFAEWHCHVAIEQRRVAREQRREQQRFTTEWTHYEARLEKDVLKSKLPSEWIPQLDPVGGETFYLNVQTTKTSSEHPNRILLRQLLKKQKAHAEQLYTERQRRLQQYGERLDAQSEAMAATLASAYRSCWVRGGSQM